MYARAGARAGIQTLRVGASLWFCVCVCVCSQDLREGTGDQPKPGDITVIDWDGYTIGCVMTHSTHTNTHNLMRVKGRQAVQFAGYVAGSLTPACCTALPNAHVIVCKHLTSKLCACRTTLRYLSVTQVAARSGPCVLLCLLCVLCVVRYYGRPFYLFPGHGLISCLLYLI